MYAVTATITRQKGEWQSTRQIPTFYLDPNVQGIVSDDHAARIVQDIINPYGDPDTAIAVKVVNVGSVDR